MNAEILRMMQDLQWYEVTTIEATTADAMTKLMGVLAMTKVIQDRARVLGVSGDEVNRIQRAVYGVELEGIETVLGVTLVQ